MKLKIVILGEGATEKKIIPILFRRSAKLIVKDIEIETVECVESPDLSGLAKVRKLLEKTYLKYTRSSEHFAQVLLVGIDNDNKKKHPPHSEEHKKKIEMDCRFCQLQEKLEKCQKEW